MRKILLVSLVLILVGTFAACNQDHERPKSDAERQEALRESSFGELTDTLDRASEVERLQENRKSELDAALEGV